MKKFLLSIVAMVFAAVSVNAQVAFDGTEAVNDGFEKGNVAVAFATDTYSFKADTRAAEDGTEFAGNWVGVANPKYAQNTGSMMYLTPAKDGTLTAYVVANSGKAMYVLEDGSNINFTVNGVDHVCGDKLDAKVYAAAVTFPATAGKKYAVYCSGSKMGFYGYNLQSASQKTDEAAYSVDATVTVNNKSNTFVGQTVSTYLLDGVLNVVLPEASVEESGSTYTMPEATVVGIEKNAYGDLSLAEGAAPVLKFNKGDAAGTATVTSVNGSIVNGQINLTVKAKYEVDGTEGTLTAVYSSNVKEYNVDATVKVNSKSQTFEGQTVKTYISNGKRYVVIPEASIEYNDDTYAMAETTLEGIELDEDGFVTLAQGAAPTVKFNKGNAAGSAVVTDVNGLMIDEELNITVTAKYEVEGEEGTMTVVYGPAPYIVTSFEATYTQQPWGSSYYDAYTDGADVTDGMQVTVEKWSNNMLRIKNWFNTSNTGYDGYNDVDIYYTGSRNTCEATKVAGNACVGNEYAGYEKVFYTGIDNADETARNIYLYPTWTYINDAEDSNGYIYMLYNEMHGWSYSQNYYSYYLAFPTATSVNAVSEVKAAPAVIKTSKYILKNGVKYNYAGQRIK